MQRHLRQSTQTVVRIGTVIAVGDGFTPVTTLSLSGADEAELLKNAGAATVDISGATFAAVTGADGTYDLTLTTSHTDTVGHLRVVINDDSLCLPVWEDFEVIEEAVYDMFYAASATGLIGTAQTGDSYAVVNSGTFGNSALKALIDTLDNFVDTEVAAIITAIGTPSDLGSGATLAANLVDIEAQTDDIGAAGAGLTAVWTTALTESYRGTGATGTGAQLLYELLAHLGEFANSGTTKTTKKLDGTTTAKVYTYDSASAPTSITENT